MGGRRETRTRSNVLCGGVLRDGVRHIRVRCAVRKSAVAITLTSAHVALDRRDKRLHSVFRRGVPVLDGNVPRQTTPALHDTRVFRPKTPATHIRSRRAQSSMEYLLISGLVFTLLVAILAMAYSQSAAFSQEVSSAQIQKVGRQIIDAADAVSYAGPPAKKTLTIYMPDHITSLTFANDTLLITGSGPGGHYEYILSASTNMSGELRPFSGIHRVTITALGTYVNITDG